uniref:Cystatin domain-containing protein n=1 Tax=Bos mutus grunniens TaxID=30521 RepID=A0A8C0AF56_BOSMU
MGWVSVSCPCGGTCGWELSQSLPSPTRCAWRASSVVVMPRCAGACPLSSSAPRRRPRGWTAQAGWILPPAGARGERRAGPGGASEPIKAAPAEVGHRHRRPWRVRASCCRWPWPCSHSASWRCPRRPGPAGDRKVGELQELSPNDPQVQKAAQVAVANYNMGSNSDYYYRDITILRAHSQLVAGIKYYLTVDMGSTACRKSAVAGDHVTSPPAPGRRSTAGGNSCVPS